VTLERLHARLRMLEPEDAEEINRMLAVLRWSSQFVEARDTAVVRRYGELMQEITNPLVREVLAAGMDMRMVLSVLRRRRHGLGPPTVGFGRWFEHIRHHFNEPDFGLGRVLPWLIPFNQTTVHMMQAAASAARPSPGRPSVPAHKWLTRLAGTKISGRLVVSRRGVSVASLVSLSTRETGGLVQVVGRVE